ncbi:MAG: hypothetical protein QNI87_14660 [Erythrobacter sp.]|uniref:hypothetical protein n=1 Tax=Erythrobacter sp. TaxID=1042 RepID=UPI00260B44E0|nr:hypothetical protein [Erythrobacter sp.]MDJ0979763.1 hypothetical protein [Erythrobacter sp.]
MWRTLFPALALALCPVQSLWAQASSVAEGQTKDESGAEIIVPGSRDKAAQKKAINRYIRAVMRTERSGQYARFGAPICPSAIGFSEGVDLLVEERIRVVARAAEVSVAEENCDPNLHVVIVEDGKDAIGALRRKHRGAFGRMRPYDREQIERGPGPVYNWHTVLPISSSDGRNRGMMGTGYVGGFGPAAEQLGDPAYNAAVVRRDSRIVQPNNQEIRHGFVLIEREAVRGLSVTQVADFATMRGLLSATSESKELQSVDTIMTLFDSPLQERPPSLREWDLALLTALYKAAPDMKAQRQRSEMARIFEATLTQDN